MIDTVAWQLTALRLSQEGARPVLGRRLLKNERITSTGSSATVSTADFSVEYESCPGNSPPPSSVSPDFHDSFGHFFPEVPASKMLNPSAPAFVPEWEKKDNNNNFPDPMRLKTFVHELSELNGDKVESDIKEILEVVNPKRVPYRGYVCHICYKMEDHFISDCPRMYCGSSLTSYQGSKKCFGEFQCKRCKRKWSSRNSYADMAMPCSKCKISTFPRKQYSLRRAMEQGKLPADSVPVPDSKIRGCSQSAGQFVMGHW